MHIPTGDLMTPGLRISTRQLGFISVMTGLSVASNYLMLSIPNVKFMDLFVFVSGYVMGPHAGVLVGSFTWLVYGTINPYGFSLPILFATMVGESLYGLAGAMANRSRLQGPSNVSFLHEEFWICNLKFGFLGFLLTFVYDLFTNLVSAVVAQIPVIVAIVFGVPFALAHEISNFFFFLFGASVMINAVQVFAVEGR